MAMRATRLPGLVKRFRATPAVAGEPERQVSGGPRDAGSEPMPVYVLGARILDLVPIVSPSGNVTISFCAFSYAGCLYLVVTADATATPDVERLIIGAQNEWQELSADRRQKGRCDVHLAQRT